MTRRRRTCALREAGQIAPMLPILIALVFWPVFALAVDGGRMLIDHVRYDWTAAQAARVATSVPVSTTLQREAVVNYLATVPNVQLVSILPQSTGKICVQVRTVQPIPTYMLGVVGVSHFTVGATACSAGYTNSPG